MIVPVPNMWLLKRVVG